MKDSINKQNDPIKESDGFTLVELLVVIAVLATVIGLSLPNFLGARARARDTRRKGEMNQLRTALQLYFNDYKSFPSNSVMGGINGCGTLGTDACPQTGCAASFAAGGSIACDTTNGTIYMLRLPGDTTSSMFYYQVNSGSDFCAKIALENPSDGDAASSQARCAALCGANASGSDYAVCSQ